MYAIEYGKKVSAPKNIEKEGYIFIDWYTTKDFTKKFDFNTKITEETHIYAKYEKKTYTISFQTNSDSLISNKIIPYGNLLDRPEDPVKTGCYIFYDWYTDDTFTTKFDFNTPIKKNYILYAKWNENHQYDEGVITTPANCTNDGVKTFACKKCGNKITESIPANGHNYDGITCTSCGNKLIDNLAELNHEYTDEDGLIVNLTSFTHSEIDGYNDYSFSYIITNSSSTIGLVPGIFKIVYIKPNGDFGIQYQSKMNIFLNAGEYISKDYTIRLSPEKQFVCLEYIPNTKQPDYLFIYTPLEELLNWIIEKIQIRTTYSSKYKPFFFN